MIVTLPSSAEPVILSFDVSLPSSCPLPYVTEPHFLISSAVAVPLTIASFFVAGLFLTATTLNVYSVPTVRPLKSCFVSVAVTASEYVVPSALYQTS